MCGGCEWCPGVQAIFGEIGINRSFNQCNMDMNLSKLWEMVRDRESCHATVHGVVKTWT